MGAVLQQADSSGVNSQAETHDGTLVRRLTPEDELLLARMERHREAAFRECSGLLEQRGIDATLVEVEQLFDGESIFFYFLGDVTPEIEKLTRELAEAYDAKVKFRQFVDAVERGCGPDCGTEAAEGCGSDGGCSTCAVAAACQVKPTD